MGCFKPIPVIVVFCIGMVAVLIHVGRANYELHILGQGQQGLVLLLKLK